MPLTIVVGTGRCGSTMLSRMLEMHPDVLSLSEFWNLFLDNGGYIPTHAMTGDEFWRRLADPAPAYDGLVLARIKQDDEIDPAITRFDYHAGMPSLFRVLAPLTSDPDSLYDALAPSVTAWPQRPLAEHCRALFGELAARLGRSVVVERTGGGLDKTQLLREQFPEARFVFMHRNGPDCALSMSRYPTVRLSALRNLAEAVSGPAPDLDLLPAEIRTVRSSDFDGLIDPPFDRERFWSFPIPLTYFGGIWSAVTRTGTREIRLIPQDRWTTLRYERLLADPSAELTRLAGFIGIPADRQWLDKTSAFADPGRTGSAVAKLHPSDVAELRAACAAGTRAFDLLESEAMATA